MEISLATLQLAHQALGAIPAKNGQQAVALANALLELEAAVNGSTTPPAKAEEKEDTSEGETSE